MTQLVVIHKKIRKAPGEWETGALSGPEMGEVHYARTATTLLLRGSVKGTGSRYDVIRVSEMLCSVKEMSDYQH